MRSRSPTFDLCLVTDRSQTQGRELLWVLERALEGGTEAIQLREKDLGGRELFHLAEKAKSLCRRHSARLFINDRVDVALGVDADGVQLGGASMPIEAARALLGTQKLIGASIHSLQEAEKAHRSGADFVLFGPVYFTPSKAPYGEPQGLERLKEVVEKTPLPVYAIGGMKATNVFEAKETGIRGVALISAVLSAADPKIAVQEVLKNLRR
ncbi:MAG: thiamine phosphate synthase [Candidatus Binatia bacterium]